MGRGGQPGHHGPLRGASLCYSLQGILVGAPCVPGQDSWPNPLLLSFPCSQAGPSGRSRWEIQAPAISLSQSGVQSQPWQVRINPNLLDSQKRTLRFRGAVGLPTHQARTLLPFSHPCYLYVP